MVVASPLNLKKVTTSVNDSKKKVTESRSTVKNIGQVLLKRTKVKREAFAQTNLFRKRREENERRQTLEDELEAPSVVVRPGGPQQLTQATGVRGFFDRILGFIGYLSAGWIMNNLPTWIAMGKEFIARIQKAGQIISGFFSNTIKLFVNVGNVLGALGQNLLRFDFFDTSNRVKTAMSELNGTMGNLTGQIEEAFSLLTTPLTEGKYSGEQIPEVGTQQTNEGAYAEPPPYTGGGQGVSGNISDKQKQALNILSKYESAGSGGYNAVNQIGIKGGRGVLPGSFSGDFKKMPQHGGRALTDMTIAEIMSLQASRPGMSNQEWIRQGRLHAVGRYQFIGMTLPGVVKRSGIPTSAKFTPEVQDLLALQYLKEAGIGAWIGPRDKATRQERAVIEAARKEPIDYKPSIATGTPQSQAPQQSSAPSRRISTGTTSLIPQTGAGGFLQGSSGKGMEDFPRYGVHFHLSPPNTSEDGLQKSRDVAFLAIKAMLVRGSTVYLANIRKYVPSNASDSQIKSMILSEQKAHSKPGRTQGGIDIQEVNRNVGPTHKGLPGSKIAFPFAVGKVSPLSSGSGYGREAEVLGSGGVTLAHGAAGSTASNVPAQIAAPTQQSNMVPSSITQERRGQDVMVVLPQQQQNIITPASGGGDMGPSPIGDFELLNNFIKNKLLLDLAYL